MNTAAESTFLWLWSSSKKLRDARSRESIAEWDCGPSIYLVDREPGVAELYALFLKGSGYRVRSFDSRADVLAGLAAHSEKPHLLITDCLADTLPIHLFIERCRVAHPPLRILMVSTLSENELRSYCLNPDRFLRKPFTASEFLHGVSAALAA